MNALSNTTSSNIPHPSILLDALAQAFSYPDEGIAATLGPLALVCENGNDASADMGEAIEHVLDASDCFADDTAEKLAYTRLFIGSLEMLAPPYASYYMTDNHTLNGRVAAEIADVYRLFGIQLEPSEKAPADHLRYMLSFLSLLAARYEETGDAALCEAYSDFCDAYIAPWFERSQQLVESNADAPYYPALVTLIGRALKQA